MKRDGVQASSGDARDWWGESRARQVLLSSGDKSSRVSIPKCLATGGRFRLSSNPIVCQACAAWPVARSVETLFQEYPARLPHPNCRAPYPNCLAGCQAVDGDWPRSSPRAGCGARIRLNASPPCRRSDQEDHDHFYHVCCFSHAVLSCLPVGRPRGTLHVTPGPATSFPTLVTSPCLESWEIYSGSPSPSSCPLRHTYGQPLAWLHCRTTRSSSRAHSFAPVIRALPSPSAW